eukprot:4488_1
MQPHFVYPENSLSNESDKVLTTKQINQWRNNGFLLINNIIPINIIKSAIKDASFILKNFHNNDFGTNGLLEFPTTSSNINKLSLHPRLLIAVSQLLNTLKFKMVQSDLWKKEGILSNNNNNNDNNPESNNDQRIHMDYPNHSLVHPPIWSKHEAVEIIIYLSNCNNVCGSTAVIPKQNNNDPAYIWPYDNLPGFGKLIYVNDRKSAEKYIFKNNIQMYEFRKQLYKREKYIYFNEGTILFYRYDLWHRGTPIKYGAIRYVQNMAFIKNNCDWIGNWNQSVARNMYRKDQLIEKMIAKITPFQRSVLFGFPSIGSSYWNKYTLEAVRKRYQCFGFDITPYKNGIHSKL